MALPFADGDFDAVVCQFGMMFLPDKAAGYREAWRVLRPGGRFLFAVWDGLEANEVPRVTHETIRSLFPADPPSFLARGPHGYHDVTAIQAAMSQAGFRTISIETVARTCRAPSAREPAVGFCQGTPMRGEIEARDASRLDEVTDAVASALAIRFGHGPIEATMQAHVVSGIR